MGEDRQERFEPTAEQREWLATLNPTQRHAGMELLINMWHLCRSIAQSTDSLVDLMIPHQLDPAAADFLTSMALRAEGLRALAVGDRALADEHFAAATRYATAAGPPRIVITEEGDSPEGGPFPPL